MPNEILIKQGTSKTWKAAGGDYAITLASLANGAGRCGQKCDLGAAMAARYAFAVEINLDAAPTAGNLIEVYWAPSHDGATFPGGATGTDAAYKAGEEDEWKKQLMLVGCVVVTNDADAVVQTQVFVFAPPARYGCPIVVNKSGQAFEGDNDAHRITLTPLVDEVQG
jgi:hypothetical protein